MNFDFISFKNYITKIFVRVMLFKIIVDINLKENTTLNFELEIFVFAFKSPNFTSVITPFK